MTVHLIRNQTAVTICVNNRPFNGTQITHATIDYNMIGMTIDY